MALAQITAASWALFAKYRTASSVEPALPADAEKSVPQHLALVNPPKKAAAPVAPVPAATPAAPVASLPNPTPVPAEKITPESRLTDLVQQERALREKGDMSTALVRLREAQAIAPNSALVISELAMTFEKMGQTDKSLEQWRRIFDMGESAGIYYQAADAKLKAGEADTVAASKHNGTESSGIQPGSILGLGTITTVEETDPEALKKILLKIPLRARQNSDVEVKDVVIQVFFYDLIDNNDIVQTNANVSSHWSTLPADWKDNDEEVLEVEYAQPLPKTGKAPENRTYFGYVVRIYYKGELQDWRADQDKLRAKYPPPLTLPTDQAQ